MENATNDCFWLRYDGVYNFDTHSVIPKWVSHEGNFLFLNIFIDNTGVTGERWIFNTQGKGILVSEREVNHDFIDGESGWLLYDPNSLQIIGGAFCQDRTTFYCSPQFRHNTGIFSSCRPNGMSGIANFKLIRKGEMFAQQ